LTLATAIKDLGFISWFSDHVDQGLEGLAPFGLLIILALIYFYSMYLFSMLTAHIAALAGAIFVVASDTNLDPYLIIGVIAYSSSLCGCLTNYSTGPIIIYFGNGYSKPKTWFKIGLLISFYHLTIWFVVGSLWWKFIGWW
jgi:DASS family divalent anion:Na+ symporter